MIRMAFLLGLMIQAALPPTPAPSQGAKEAAKVTAEQPAESGEAVHPPMDVRGSTGVLVFLGWMWLAILVLVFVLGWKIREADRLHDLRY